MNGATENRMSDNEVVSGDPWKTMDQEGERDVNDWEWSRNGLNRSKPPRHNDISPDSDRFNIHTDTTDTEWYNETDWHYWY